MRSVKRPILFNLLIGLALAVTSCNLPSRLANEAATSTAAAQTLQAQLTLFAPTTAAPPTFPVVTTVPPPTQSPSSTPVIPTATSSCDIAQFVTDVTYTDGTIVPAGQAFTKTWRFRNSGNCSWTTSYSIVFSSGDQMGGPNTQALTGNVNPGESVDISINLTAPTTPGSYRGYWKLRNAAGVLFAHFYVDIKSQAVASVTPPVAQVILNAIPSESGTVYEPAAGQAVSSSILAGDTSANFISRGFMSFDIAPLAGKTITSAALDLSSCVQAQNPFTGLGGIWLGQLQYALPLDQTDYDVQGASIQLLNALPTTSMDIKSQVQIRVTEGRARFQIRLHPAGPTNGNSQADTVSCNPGAVILKIGYQP